MHSYIALLVALSTTIVGLQNPYQRARNAFQKHNPNVHSSPDVQSPPNVHTLPSRIRPFPLEYWYAWRHRYLTPETEKFAVNGTGLPDVDFDIGESYAGLLPNSPSGNSSLFFWFFPSSNPLASNEITVWLNGGPGCSSLAGLLFENGPFLWQPGTSGPTPNPYSFTNLTNMVWVDQPAGTGFSPGPPSVFNEIDVANQFNDFWKNFMTTFGLHNRKVYLTGESYAGQYIPYIAENMLDRNDTTYYNVQGIQINDPSINDPDVLNQAPAVQFLEYWSNVFNLNDTFLSDIHNRAVACGYDSFMSAALQFPPLGQIIPTFNSSVEGCDVWDDILEAAFYVNPCFDLYHITSFCPYQSDVLGYPSLNPGPINYFNSSEVQDALHVPSTKYSVCGEYDFLDDDGSVPSALGPLPRVIEATNNTVIGHGSLDFILLANGTLATIQNMTWNGAQGFQEAPSSTMNFYVPYHDGLAQLFDQTAAVPFLQDAGAGLLGTTHTERGLTFVTVRTAGHMIPWYAPGAAYRMLEFLLGRISSLTEVSDYTTLAGDFAGNGSPSV